MNIYNAAITDDFHVIVTINGIEVDRPGPWANANEADLWATMIITDLENGIDHYGNQKEAN